MVYWGKRGYIDEGRRKKMYSRLVMMGLEGSFYIIAALPFRSEERRVGKEC